MVYQVYYETWHFETTPVKWCGGIPIKYKYIEQHYAQPIETFKTLKRAKERAKSLRELTDVNGRKYHNIKVTAVK